MIRPVVLIADADATLRTLVRTLLAQDDREIREAATLAAFRHAIRAANADVVVFNNRFNGPHDGLDVVAELQPSRGIPCILITRDSSEPLAIAAIKLRLADFFKIPFEPRELVASVGRCIGGSLPSRNRTPVRWQPDAQPPLLGDSPQMADLRAYIERVAPTDSNILITGETGTGKEVVARLVHRCSARAPRPFVSINCAAVPEHLLESELFGYERGAFTGAHAASDGRLSQATGGTAFFDEIGEMSGSSQAKILRAIESREIQRLGGRRSLPVDFRVLAATNQDLEQCVDAGRFRKDLYFRLNIGRIHLPPLRDRREDLRPLLDYYIAELNERFARHVADFSTDALNHLAVYDWPGNVRELKNLVESAFVNLTGRDDDVLELPDTFRRRLDGRRAVADERAELLSALFSTRWNKSEAANKLHWSRMTLYRKMAKYHVSKTRGPARKD